ncbi:MAG: hypothetical protein K2J08_13120, partial [Ruminococcus sp.]|nr:hypothetical protein [Ruminococcus sp.]
EKPQSHKSHSRFDISDYERICVNNYNVVGYDYPIEEEKKCEEEKKRLEEEEWKLQEKMREDAHFEEMLADIYRRAGGTA